MNSQKLNYLRNNISFKFEDLSLTRQLELQARPEPKEWLYLALAESTLENWEQWGFGLMDKPEFRKRIDLKLNVINREDDKAFAKAYANELKRSQNIPEETARKQYNKCKLYWPHFGGEVFTMPNTNRTVTFTFVTPGVTEHGKEEFIRIMSTTNSFEDLKPDEWFALWAATISDQTTIQEPQRLRMGQASMVSE